MPNNDANGNTFDAVINGGTLTQDIAPGVTIQQLFMNGGTLRLTNPLTLNAGLKFTGGAITLGTLNVAGSSTQGAQMVVNTTTINNSGDYALALAGNAFSGGSSIFNNSGTLRRASGAGTANFNMSLANTGTVLAETGTFSFNSGGTSSGLASAASGAILQFGTGFTFNNASFGGAGQVRFSNASTNNLSGTITNNGNLLVNSTGSFTDLVLNGDVTLAGNGTLTLSNAARIRGSGTLINVGNTIAGEANNTGSGLGADQIGVVNQAGGLISANISGAELNVDPSAALGLTNRGTMQASGGGILLLNGNNGGAFDNVGGTILALDGSQVQLANGSSITGGILNSVGSGFIRVVNGATLASLTNAGDLRITNGTSATLVGTINNTGTIGVISTGSFTDLLVNSDVTLLGGGTITLANAGRLRGTGTFFNGGANGEAHTIQGEANNTGSGIGNDELTVVNRSGGLIDANVNGAILNVDPGQGGLTNQGLIRASNGGILFLNGNGGGAFTNQNLISALDGSEVRLSNNVLISGGTLSTIGSGVIRNAGTATLDSLTNTGAFIGNNASSTTLTGTITNTGSILLNSTGSFTDLIIEGDVTLTGGSAVTLRNAARIRGGGTLFIGGVNGEAFTIQGEANNTGSGLGANELTIVNRSGGIVDANVSSEVLNVNPGAGGLTNRGLLRARNGGVLQLNGGSGGGFDNVGGTITALEGSEVLVRDGAAISGGLLSSAGTGLIRIFNTGSFTDLTTTANIRVNNAADLSLAGTINNTGSITVASTGSFTDLIIDGTTNLTGSGVITLSNAGRIRGTGTLFNSTLIQGEANNTGSGLGANQLTVVNQAAGVVDANVSGAVLNVDPGMGGLTNQGLMRASNGGRLRFNGNGGGAVNNQSTIIALDGSEVELFGGITIAGGTLATSGSGVIRNINGAVLDSITNTGTFIANNGADTTLLGTVVNTGNILLNSTGSFTDLIINSNVTLTGGSALTLANAARVRGTGTLFIGGPNGEAFTIQGEANNTGSGLGANELTVVNRSGGIVQANVANGVLNVDPGAGGLTNQGLMRAMNQGLLQLNGNGGGAFNNTGGQIIALDLSQVYLTNGASITGGTMATQGSGAIRVLTSTSLTDLQLAANFIINNAASATIAGTINNTGSISINSSGSFTDLILNGDVTLTGGGNIFLANAGRIRGSGILTNAGNTISGEANNTGSGIGFNQIGIVNQANGIIEATVSGGVLNVDPNAVNGLTNAGVMRARNGGILQLNGNGGGSFTNTGTIEALSGGTLRFNGTVNSSGTVDVGSSSLTATGNYTQTDGVFRLTGGTAQSNNALNFQGGLVDAFGTISAAIINNATLRPALGGSGLVVNGNVSLLTSSQLVFQLGGLTQGSQYGFMRVNGQLTLGGQLVLSFVNGFQNSVTGADSFTLMTSSNAFIGAFTNIASGSRLTTSDGSGSFVVNYNGNTLTLSAFTPGSGLPEVTSRWSNAANGNWTDGTNWSTNPAFPNNNASTLYNAVIDATGAPYTITLANPVTVQSFTLNSPDATLSLNSGGVLRTVNTSVLDQGTLVVNGGTLRGGTLNILGGMLRFTTSGNNILDGVTVNGVLDLIEDSAFVRLQNGSTFSSADLDGANSRLVIEGTTGSSPAFVTSLSNANINLNGTNATFGLSGNVTLTLNDSVAVLGHGFVSSDRFFGGVGTLINRGLISAQDTGQTLTVNPDILRNETNGEMQVTNGATLTISSLDWNNNSGLLLVNNGTLNLDGRFTNPGAISRSGGTINVTGEWANTGNTYTLNSTTGDFRLNGGLIQGGILNLSGATLRFSTSGSNILDAVTVNGTMQLSENSAFVRLINNATFTQADLGGANSALLLEGTTGSTAPVSRTLSGALVNLNGTGSTFGLSGNITLTLAATTTVRGRGFISSERFFAGEGSVINQGLISADVAGETLTINPDSFANAGTAQVVNGATLTIAARNWANETGTLLINNGTLNLDGTFTTPGAINRTGGTINITGTWNNTGRTYTLNASTGDFRLNGGTILGGTLNQSGGALRFSTSGSNILDGVTVNGTMLLSEASAFVRLINNASFTQADLTGSNSRLVIEGSTGTSPAVATTLSGATVNLDGTGAGLGLSGNVTLTLAPSTTIRGRGFITKNAFFGGAGTLINQGLISADIAGATLLVDPIAFANAGTAQVVNGATLTIGATNWANDTGTLLVNNGTLNLDGTFTNPGSISRTGGTINVTGTWNNTGRSYLLSTSTGDFRLNGGTIRGGTINQDGGVLRFSPSGSNILDGVNVSGALQLSESSAFVRLINGASFTQADLTGASASLVFEGSTGANPAVARTLSGATVNMDASGSVFGMSGNITLTLAANTTVRGRGSILSSRFFAGQGTLINQGLISSDLTGQTLTIDPDVFTNQGTVQALTGSTLTIGANNWSNPTGTLRVINSGVLNLDGTFTNPGAISRDGGTINITGTWNNTGLTYNLTSATGDFRLNGGTIVGGTINQSAAGALRFSPSGSNILDAVTITAPLQLSETSAFVRLINNATFTQADLTGASSSLLFEGSTGSSPAVARTLSGATVNMNASGSTFGLSGNITLTLAPNTTVRGRGSINSGRFFAGTGTVINQGTISADLAQALTINPDVFTNQGNVQALTGSTLTIDATNWSNPTGTLTVINSGVLNLDGTFTSPGTISRDGGTINIIGTWNNTGLVYDLTASTGDFRLNGGTIIGGTINQSANGSLRYTSSGSNILDAVTLTGPMQLSETSAFVRLINNASFTTANLSAASTSLLLEGSTGTAPSVARTLSGATVNMNGSGSTFGISGNLDLTLGANTVVRGRGSIASERFFAGTGNIINQGTIAADLSGQTLTVSPDSFRNEGGTVRTLNGGALNFSTPYVQSAGFANSVLELNGGTVSSSSALQINGGTLTGFGQINAAIQNNATLRPGLGGALNVNGNVSLLSASSLVFQIRGLTAGTDYGRLNVTGNASLGGTLVVSFVNGFQAANSNSFTVLTSTAPLAGAFGNVASNGRLTTSNNNGSFLVNYSGNNIVLSDFMPSPTPAPSRGASAVPAQPSAVDARLEMPTAGATDAESAVQLADPVTSAPEPIAPPVARPPQVRQITDAAAAVNMPSVAATQGISRDMSAPVGANASRATLPRAETINIENSTELLDLLENSEAVTAGGKAAVKAARTMRGAKAKDRQRSVRAVISLPTRNTVRPAEQDREAASVARPAPERVRVPSTGVRAGAPE